MKSILLAATMVCSAASAADLDSRLAEVVRDPTMELASLSVLSIKDGKVNYQQQFGVQRFGGAPVRADTMFRIASISKMVTTVGLMRLVEEGKLKLDEDVSTYLGFPLRNPNFPERAITLRSMLSHTSSLRDDGGYFWPNSNSLASMIGKASWAANAGPGDYFTYSNLNWGIIGTIMEKVSGERFDRLMRRLVLEPLGIQGGYNPTELPLDKLATLYRKRTTDTEIWDAKGPWIAQVDDYSQKPPAAPAADYKIGVNATPFSPTGGLRISAPDLGKLMFMFINKGAPLLTPTSMEAMLKRHWTYDGKNGDTLKGFYGAWGLGNQHFDGAKLVEGGSGNYMGHLGDAYGLVSTFVVDIERKQGMIVLAGGSSADPELQHGKYSSLSRFMERILTELAHSQ